MLVLVFLGQGMALKTIANPQSATGVTAFGGSLGTLAALPVVVGAENLQLQLHY